VAELTGVPVASLFRTLPPEPPGPAYQSPWFAPKGAGDVGAFDRRSPSIAKPPTGGLTGATPVGGASSVKVAEAVRLEGWPVPVTCIVAPMRLSEKMYQLVWKLPFASATTSHGWNAAGSGDNSTTIMFTVSLGANPVPVI